MDKVEYRSIIKYLTLKGLTPTQIHADMVGTLGDNAPSFAIVKRWAAEFKRGRKSIEDDPRSGRPSTATTTENIDRVHKMVMDDRRLTVRFIAETVGISQDRVHHILNNELEMTKVSARWVPRLLTPDQKRTRLGMSRENLEIFEADPDDFTERFMTMDECWVHHFEPETKKQSMQWKHASSPPPKKAKVVSSAGKVMASVFWDAKGVVLVDYLEKGQTINGEYYSNLLRQLREAVKKKRPGKLTKGVLFHQDNAPVHKSVVAMATLHDCGFELIQHPPYSPDLAPSDFHLFPNMKKDLAGKRYHSDDDVISAVTDFFDDKDETFYKSGIQALQHRWQKCVDRNGDYVEK